MLDTLIKDVRIIDGSGAEPFCGSVGIKDGKIVMARCCGEAAEVIEGAGRYLTPGFIDFHSHGDGMFMHPAGNLCKVNQGITTQITGQCGTTMFPVDPGALTGAANILSICTKTIPEEFAEFTTARRYFEYVDGQKMALNAKIFVGHSAVRHTVMGYDARRATAEELARMKELVREAMEAGAMGMSTGLIYPPGCYSDTEELVELCRVVAEYGGTYATHMRNEAGKVIASVKEALEIGRRSGCALSISHMKVSGAQNHGASAEMIRLVNEAAAQGQRVTCDQYPYTASMTALNVCIPKRFFSEGLQKLTEDLKDKRKRAEIRAAMLDRTTQEDNYHLNCSGFSGIYISSLPKTPRYAGMFVAEAAERAGRDPFDFFFDMLAENGCLGNGIYYCIGEEDIANIIMAENTVVGSDGLCRDFGELTHPRSWGAFPHALDYFVRQRKLMTLPALIRKMTSLPADRAGLKNKGRIAEGCDAHLVLLDWDSFADNATYRDPCALADGFDRVIVAGRTVYRDKKLTGEYPGRLLRHNAK